MGFFLAKRRETSRFRVARKTYTEALHPRDAHGRWTDGTLNDPNRVMTPEEERLAREERKRTENVADYDLVPAYKGDDPEITKALVQYKRATGDGDAYTINRELRAGVLSAETEKSVANIDRAFAEAAAPIRDYHTKQPKDAWLYRGIDGRFPLGSLKEGDVITDKGFASTTTNHIFANEWVRQKDPTGKSGAVLKITVPKETRVLRLPDSSGQDEGEVVLNRGTSFRVTRMAPNRVIEVEVVR